MAEQGIYYFGLIGNRWESTRIGPSWTNSILTRRTPTTLIITIPRIRATFYYIVTIVILF
jgi:hypothetical protein